MKKPAQNCLLLTLIAAGLCFASYGSKGQNSYRYNIHFDRSLDLYQSYINSLNPNNLFTINAAVKKFRETFRHHPLSITDTAFLQFWNFYLTAADLAGDRLTNNERFKPLVGINDYNTNSENFKTLEYDLIYRKHILNKNDFSLLNLLNSCGLMFDIKEDYLIVNFGPKEYILNGFGNYLSPAMKDYISETIKEAKEKFVENDTLVLPENKLLERIAWWKNFIKNNNDFILISECKETYSFYLNILQHGIIK